MEHRREIYTVNLFRPKKGYMRDEVLIILTALFGWGGMTFGILFFVWLMGESPRGAELMSGLHFFNLPFHFWVIAQFLPLWFIILCIVFNVNIDRLTQRHSRRRDRTYE